MTGCSPLSARSRRRYNSRGIADDRRSRGNITRHDASRPDDGFVADADPRKDDRAAADPGVFADAHRAAELPAGTALGWIPRMIRRVDLYGWTNLRALADGNLDYVEDPAIVIEERGRAEP